MSQRNAEFYSQDIVFRVDDELFKAPKNQFVRHSQAFREMFSIPQPEGVEPDGSSDDRPLVLEGIKKKDFIALLRCLSPEFQTAPGNGFSLDQWKSVLKLSNLYGMDKVKNLAVKCMTPLLKAESSSLQIQLSLAHDVPQWLQPAKARLVERTNPIEENDVQLIGLTLALEVCQLREKAWKRKTLQEKALRNNEKQEHSQREKVLRKKLLEGQALWESERKEHVQWGKAQRAKLLEEILFLENQKNKPVKSRPSKPSKYQYESD